ncbi:hypothetical protein [Anaerocolumna xylanovorans]|uniref:Uncharacterized protein n=1 Tax=Anaerocolumna xylanovorans DSM 12503 TaxID=1121345 RepID=A0A1M7YM83_9FIRM|nr:hypothetical protein [Anaerocolumna xylanovorans]SHO53709.1 hypothetical protein SAMN02745217_04248 [Anaerocolumna xylanovorans DSM 12503]
MSVLYPELTNTKFPDEIDTINNFVDITLSTLPLAKRYYEKYNSGDMEGAKQILADNPDLKYSYIGAATLNPIVDSIKALELFYTQDVQEYLVNIVQHKGAFSASAKYKKYNTVSYVHNSALETFMCISNNTPIGIIPTDTSYWVPLTMRGEKGEAGIGLTAYGDWNSITTYPKDALVAYNNALWGAKVSNTAITPSVDTIATWYKVIDFSSDYAAYIDKTTGVRRKLVVDNNRIFLEEVM